MRAPPDHGLQLSTYASEVPRFVHILADAVPILADPCLGLSTEYPWAMTFVMAAILATFTLEWLLHASFRRRLCLEAEREDAATSDPEAQPATLSSVSARNAGIADREGKIKRMENTISSYTFEAGIIFHSKRSCRDSFARLRVLSAKL